MTEQNPPDAGSPPGQGVRERGRPLHRRYAVAIIVAVLVVGGLLAWLLQRHLYSLSHVRTDDAQIGADIYPVSPRIAGHVTDVFVHNYSHVQAGQPLVTIDQRDYLTAYQQAQAAYAQAASTATAAQRGVTYTEQTGMAGVSQAQAQIAAARAIVASLEHQAASAADQIKAAQANQQAAAAAVDAAQRNVAAAQAQVVSARATAQDLQKTAQRMQQLLRQGAVSQQQADQAAAAATAASAAVTAAQAEVQAAEAAERQARDRLAQAGVAVGQATAGAAAARAQVSQAQAGIRQAMAAERAAQATGTQVGVQQAQAKAARVGIDAARAQLEKAKLNLTYTRITSPVSGTVAQKNVTAGQYVQPGQPLMAVVATDTTYVDANFKETQLRNIKPGQRATFTVDAYPGVTFHGRVRSISPGTGAVFSLLPPENATGNFTKVVQRVPVRITIDAASRRLRPLRDGMSAVVTVETR